MLLDMRNEAYIIRYLDVNVTEDPIIPFEETYRYYIFGSPKASVSVIGITPLSIILKMFYEINYNKIREGTVSVSPQFSYTVLHELFLYLRWRTRISTNSSDWLLIMLLYCFCQ